MTLSFAKVASNENGHKHTRYVHVYTAAAMFMPELPYKLNREE